LAQRDERAGLINHDALGAAWLLERGFSRRFAPLAGGHVDAKRCLASTNPAYLERLSPASQETLRLQGGPMNPEEAGAFSAGPDLRDILRLRTWDESAKEPRLAGSRHRDLSRTAEPLS
jgi:predicted HD phosphohydrolase